MLGTVLMINYVILIALTFSRFASKFVRVCMSRNFIIIGYISTFISLEDFCTSHRLWFFHCHGLLFSNNSSESQFDIDLGFLSSEHRVFILNLLDGTDFPVSDPMILFQSLSLVLLFVSPWTAAHQASLSFTIS